ncbi:phosphoglycolate phosphatase [Serratia symbiotica]|uniref:phosphoglycolate phosphatase n=1 Tax=Serratia symbiotica TaxID=138074 RepID=UPI001329AC36|nr:phosphoglycolate phosphatase [Serratia symbiotica]MBF1994923.1 phosphoglycolate phosphatase [Serratia symbiotica]MBQ0954966.1 phosphoglycolate phosphatase [Serratia symbiotica]QTP14373.1 phosphoglycolate phosphatase [Serratia symbiotica]
MADFSAIRALAFDLDGTLVDSVPSLAVALDLALVEMGLPPAGEARVGTWIGNGADILVQRALCWTEAAASPQQASQLRERFDHFYAQTIDSGSRLFPQVKETLAHLAAQGYLMALVTNKPTLFVAPLLATFAIGDYFSLVIGGDVTEKKPHPAPLYLALGKLGLRANELLFVGDSRNDIQAAQGAGCPCVGLAYGYNYGESIALSHPDCVLERFADLLPVLGLSSLEDQEI